MAGGATLTAMSLHPRTEELVRLFCASVDSITHADLKVNAPISMYKRHYTELLETMRATGELDGYGHDMYVDPDTGLLCAGFRLRLPQFGTDTIE